MLYEVITLVSADDDLWQVGVKNEAAREWLENRPYLGICLGGQMLARLLGARVYFHPEGLVEIGYYPIYPTDLGRRMAEPWPEHVYRNNFV